MSNHKKIGVAALVFASAFIVVKSLSEALKLLQDAGTSSGDRLSFFGGIVGAVVGITGAIFSTMFIERWKTDQQAGRAQRLVRSALMQMRSTLVQLAEPRPEPAERAAGNEQEGRRLLHIFAELDDAIELLDLSIDTARMDRFEALHALQRLRRVLKRHQGLLAKENDALLRFKPTGDVIRISRALTAQMAEDVLPPLNDAIAVLR